MKFLIITADDYGLHEAVNEAVDMAFREGVLTTASLMVGAPAAADAVRRARALPGLAVGLHLVLADGRSVLPPGRIPALVDASGRFRDSMARQGLRFFAMPTVRRQLEAEIRAQFEAFARTGLPLDHVNAHKHFHLHPTLLEMALRIGREFGLAAVRLPREPVWVARRAGPLKGAASRLLTPWLALMKRRLRAAGVTHNDQVFGVTDSGAMDEAALLRILTQLPDGVSEIYLHPGTRGALTPAMSQYRHREELDALLSPRVRAAVAASGSATGGFLSLVRAQEPMRSPRAA